MSHTSEAYINWLNEDEAARLSAHSHDSTAIYLYDENFTRLCAIKFGGNFAITYEEPK